MKEITELFSHAKEIGENILLEWSEEEDKFILKSKVTFGYNHSITKELYEKHDGDEKNLKAELEKYAVQAMLSYIYDSKELHEILIEGEKDNHV